jgi:hypothetical protein
MLHRAVATEQVAITIGICELQAVSSEVRTPGRVRGCVRGKAMHSHPEKTVMRLIHFTFEWLPCT